MENSQLLCELLARYPSLSSCKEQIWRAGEMMLETYRQGGKILVLGNGGSASDSEHIVGELMKGFMKKREMSESMKDKFRQRLGKRADRLVEGLQCAIPAISLPSQCGVLSAFANDVDPELVYAQLVMGYGRQGDLLIALSTSGNSRNAVAAAEVA
jgi:D-sedoheptulose 7-phosphate isomerase